MNSKTHTYRGYTFTSFKARTNYGHFRIKSATRPDGQRVNLKDWGLDGAANIGQSHEACFKYAIYRIDYELDNENSEIGKTKKWFKENPYSLY